MIGRLLDRYADLLAMVAGLMLVVFTVIVSYQVVSRYVDWIPRVFWTEEVSRFSFIWMLFLGAAVAVHRGTHFTIELFADSSRPGVRFAQVALVQIIIIAVATVMIYGGSQFVQMGMSRLSTVSGIRLSWIYLAIPLCGVSSAAFALNAIAAAWRQYRQA
jgi:TRAP-type transport system small permease protein